MKQYLESEILKKKILQFWKLNRPVGAICHGKFFYFYEIIVVLGVLLLARTIDDETGKSILYNKKTTTLPRFMENLAYYLTVWEHGHLYKTYDVSFFDKKRL